MATGNPVLSGFLSWLLLLGLAHTAHAACKAIPNRDNHKSSSLNGGHGTQPDLFQIQVIRAGAKYRTGQQFWAFSGEDAIVVPHAEEAAWFYVDNGQLRTGNQYVNLDTSNEYAILELESKPTFDGISFNKDSTGAIQITGPGLTLGNGHGLACVSSDGNLFVASSRKPPFSCLGVSLHAKAAGSESSASPNTSSYEHRSDWTSTASKSPSPTQPTPSPDPSSDYDAVWKREIDPDVMSWAELMWEES